MDFAHLLDWAVVGAVYSVTVTVIDWVVRVLALIYVPRNRRPQTALAWLLLIMFLPVPGIIVFWLFGSRRLSRSRRRKQREIDAYILERTRIAEIPVVAPTDHWLGPVVELNRTLGTLPLVSGNSAALFSDYAESIAAMTEAVRGARASVDCEFYILTYDAATASFFDALQDAVTRGIRVRVLLDHVAAFRQPGYRRTLKQLRRIGVEWRLMLPVRPFHFQRIDLRNHRKILVIDGSVAFTGSQNLVDASYNKRANRRRGLQWKDLMVRFEGPIAGEIGALFISDWFAETGELPVDAPNVTYDVSGPLEAQVVPSGPGFAGENNLRLFNALVYAARERIILVSPYFVPDDSMMYAITTAAQSGLEVQLFVSEIGDQPLVYHAQRSYYETLLRAGVRIFLYRSPTLLHAKHFTIDDDVAVIGSSNMDMRSFSLNAEISVLVRGASFVRDLRAVEDAYRDASSELTIDDWMRQSRVSKTLDNLARLTATVQ